MSDEGSRTQVKPSLGDVLRNLRGAGNPLTAVRGMASNTLLKIQRRDNCCGNYGDPGC
jgi:hypothetical protein